jgi:ribonuclease HI
MKPVTYHIYSDASFSGQYGIGVAGFLVIEGEDDCAQSSVQQRVRTKVLKEKNNIRAELRSVIFALQTLIEELAQSDVRTRVKRYHINLYTDCHSVAHLLDRRERLESSDFISNKTKKSLGNADLYKQFFAVYDKVNPVIFWVKGHTPTKDRNRIQKNFSRVDRAVRQELRKKIKN